MAKSRLSITFGTAASAPLITIADARRAAEESSLRVTSAIEPPPVAHTAPGPFNLADNVRLWSERMGQRHNAQTARAKVSRLRRFTDWLRVAGVTLNDWRDVTPALVDRFIAWRSETPAAHRWRSLPGEDDAGRLVKPATIARDVESLARWLAWNEEREMAGSIRSVYLRGRVTERRQGDTFSLTKAQQAELLRCAWLVRQGQSDLKWTAPGRKRGTMRRKSATCTHWPAGAFHAFCRLGLELGLRPRELFWVAWEDLAELGDGRAVLEVRDHHAEVNGRRVLINAIKTRQSRRKLLVPADLWAELQALREGLHAAGDLRRFLFAVRDDRTPHGWAKPEISFAFRALKEALAEPRLVCNTLRKTCGKNLRDAGLDYFAVAQFLGHSPQTTLQHYVSDCRQEEAFDPVNARPVKLAAIPAHAGTGDPDA